MEYDVAVEGNFEALNSSHQHNEIAVAHIFRWRKKVISKILFTVLRDSFIHQ
jgi:hypothetical protein